MHVVRGHVKDYDWGVVDGLVPWCGDRTGRPQAELWFGAHPSGPSPLLRDDGAWTGEVLADRLAVGDAPLLVKLLAAASPLSIQVHPDGEHAAAGWRRERPDGVEPDSPVYVDAHEKTEMLVALEPFEALAGWRDPTLAAAVLEGAGAPPPAVALVRAGDRPAAIRLLLAHPRAACTAPIARVPVAAAAAGVPAGGVDVLARIGRRYPDDPGVFVAVLLDHVTLGAGDALYLPAGVPHSYTNGLGLEVMTASDNVMRLGLTTKRVAVDECLAALRDDRSPTRLAPGDWLRPPGAPFAALLVEDGKETLAAGRYRVVVALEGTAEVRSGHSAVSLSPGTAVVLEAADPESSVVAHGRAALVTEHAG